MWARVSALQGVYLSLLLVPTAPSLQASGPFCFYFGAEFAFTQQCLLKGTSVFHVPHLLL